jgi:hypothetical protein
MADDSIRNLLQALKEAYPSSVMPYGQAFENAENEHGLGWRLDGVPASFSAITFDATLPANRYDIQIESYPPGDYIFTGQFSLDELLELVRKYFKPETEWPVTSS